MQTKARPQSNVTNAKPNFNASVPSLSQLDPPPQCGYVYRLTPRTTDTIVSYTRIYLSCSCVYVYVIVVSQTTLPPLPFRNGTSMISLIIPPKDQISRVAKMLADEFGTASNIKSRVNRLSVLGAITSVQQRLKLYNKGRGPCRRCRSDGRKD